MKLVFMQDDEIYNINYEVINFPSGEMTVRFKHDEVIYSSGDYKRYLMAFGVMTPADVFIVQAARQYLENNTMVKRMNLLCPFYPSARQDRIATDGDVNMLKVYHEALSAGFDRVITYDAHSLAAETLVDTSCSVRQLIEDGTAPCVRGLAQGIATGSLLLVAPDSGALKRVEQVAKRFGDQPVVYGIKKRNPVNGNIEHYEIIGDVKGRDCLIIDDICDGGRTFTGCASKLYRLGATSVSLFVTHGLFTKGLDVLLDNGIKYIYTTDSTGFEVPEGYEDRVFVLNSL